MIALKSSESKASFNVLNRSRASTLGMIAATPKARTRTHTAARKPLYHQRVANGTVRNCLGRICISCGFLDLASLPRRTNDANETALSFQPDCEWSDWGERHGRLRCEVAVERSGSCRDTIGQFARQPFLVFWTMRNDCLRNVEMWPNRFCRSRSVIEWLLHGI